MEDSGSWQLYYQVRVIDAARWVSEPIGVEAVMSTNNEDSNLLIGYGLFNPITIIGGLAVVSLFRKDEQDEE